MFVGLDVGTSGVKAVAVSPAGEVLARAEEEYPLSTPAPGWSEQDPEDWWRASEAALAAVGAESAAGIGLSGQMHGLVALDGESEVIRPAILWNDQRTSAECEEIERRIGVERLIRLTGNRALTGFTAPKLLWLREHEPDAYARIRHVLLPKDYVRLRLTGEHATDVADASGTLLFDVAERRWSGDVLDALEIPAEWLPEALESPEVSGRTANGTPGRRRGRRPGGRRARRRRRRAGAAVGRPRHLRGRVRGASGLRARARRRGCTCSATPSRERWHAMGVMLSAAGSLRWFRDAFAPGTPYDELVAEAEGVEPGAEGVLFLPYLSGERTPHADPYARAAFTGLGLEHGRPALVRAVLEGVAYGLRDSLELLQDLGVRAETGRASGGGARSRLWLRIVASVLGLPLELTAVEEGAAFGAALLGGVAAGAFADVHEAVEACVRPRERIEPDEGWQRAYEAGYPRYRALYPSLEPLEER